MRISAALVSIHLHFKAQKNPCWHTDDRQIDERRQTNRQTGRPTDKRDSFDGWYSSGQQSCDFDNPFLRKVDKILWMRNIFQSHLNKYHPVIYECGTLYYIPDLSHHATHRTQRPTTLRALGYAVIFYPANSQIKKDSNILSLGSLLMHVLSGK